MLLSFTLAASQVPLTEIKLTDVQGETVSPLKGTARATVFFFIRSDCPISNRYAPLISELSERYAPRGIGFWLIYVDPQESNHAIVNHLDQYHLKIQALRDSQHSLVALTGVTVTPEAVVVLKSGQTVYRGRIDDRYLSPGTSRPEPTSRDLERVLEAVDGGRGITPATTSAVGCFISDLLPARQSRKP